MADQTKLPGGGTDSEARTVNSPNQKNDLNASPATRSSGDTPHDDGSFGVRSNGGGAFSLSSPLSVQNLDFHKLTLDDGGVSPTNTSDRYTSPHHRGIKLFAERSSPGTPPRDFRRETNSRFGNRSHGRAAVGDFRSSRTWISPEAQAQQEFLVIRNSMRRLFKNSDVAKWKLSDYINHREAMLASQANKLASEVQVHERALRVRDSTISPELKHHFAKWGIEGNFDEHGNFGRVLGEQTIWCADWQNGKDEIAPWPTIAEMKWEGDDRAKTGVGRFLPLPREQGPPTLPWNQLPVVDQYPIDQVAKIPTMEDIYLPIDDQIEAEKEYLWSKELEQEMDAFLDS